MNIAFIGLGMMGRPMVRNLLRGGHQVTGFDLDKQAVQALQTEGMQTAGSPKEAALGAAIVVTMLPNDKALEAAVFGDSGIVDGISKDALYVDMSTAHPLESDGMRAKLAELGIAMVDAPVGRTAAHAETGELLVLFGGEPEQLEILRPLFDCVGESVVDCGGPGRGIRMKLVNNFMSISLNALSAEALALCEKLDLPRDIAIDMMQGTPAGKGHFTTTYPKKVFAGDDSPDFALRLAHKDLGLTMDLAGKLNLPMPTGAAAREVYSAAMARGFGNKDWTALLNHVIS